MRFKPNKKAFLLVALLPILLLNASAQDLRIPYRVGDKFGLANEKGKLKVEAVYDQITFMDKGFQYFQYWTITKDSIRKVTGGWAPREIVTSGVIHNDKVLIKDSPFRSFRVYKDVFIVGAENNDQRPEDCMLYNLKGKPLLESNVNSIYFNSKRDVGKLSSVDTNLMLVSMFHDGERGKRKFSIVSYDIGKQEISNWLIEKATSYKLLGEVSGKNAVQVQYTDEQGPHRMFLSHNAKTGQFQLSISLEEGAASEERIILRQDRSIAVQEYAFGDEEIPEEVVPRSRFHSVRPTPKVRFSFKANNVLHYGNSKVIEIEGAQFVKKNVIQESPMIYRLSGKYGLVLNDSSYSAAKYDTLFYMNGFSPSGKDLGHLYLVGEVKDENRKWQYGVINHLGETIIPIEYDCLLPHIPTLTWEFYQKHFDEPLNYFTAPIKSQSYSSKRKKYYAVGRHGLIGEKDGMVGMVSLDNEVTIPFEFDGIYYNDMSYTHPVRSQGDYMIIHKGDRYAMVKDLSFSMKKLNKKLVFQYLPASYYPNYGGKEGFHLVRLITPDGSYAYANMKGFKYFSD